MSASKNKYDAVVFDLFGTLVDFGPEGYFEENFTALAKFLSLPADSFIKMFYKMTEDRFIGRFDTLEDEFKYICNAFGSDATPEQIADAVEVDLSFYSKFVTPRDGTIETITELRSRRLKTGIVTDCTSEVPRVWNDTPMAALPDTIIFSCTAKVAKPDPRIYMKACESLGVKPEKCLYIGDGSGRELTGARSVGMDAVLIKVGYDSHMDYIRPDVPDWDGPIISHLSEVPRMVG